MTAELLRQLESGQVAVQDGLLYFNDPNTKFGLHPLKQVKLYAPTAICGCLFKYYHDHPTAGHLGI